MTNLLSGTASRRPNTIGGYLWLVICRASSEALDWAQAVFFVLLIAVAFVPQNAPYSKFADKYVSWHGGVIILACVLLVRLIFSPYWIYRDQQEKISDLELEVSGNADNTKGDALKFEPAPSGGSVRKTMLDHGGYRYEGMVRLRNTGNGYITNAVVRIKNASPSLPDGSFRILKPGSTLQKGQPADVCIVTYFDKIVGAQPGTPGSELLRLAAPIAPGWGSRPTDISPPASNAPLKLVIEASADGCAAVEKHFLIWVDDNKNLQVEAS
ncbi:hypothetical protein [Acidisoma silvae]|uniref:Uncharacterized protein n=1 Tax=Acidisoma silvae TaxID=2802396 RepID=A0A963YVI7_9PROT|nr:hypothetical protein [Acidisoma silvae]MCB8877614.1 hypothetical protein [Acidisoma silvae]